MDAIVEVSDPLEHDCRTVIWMVFSAMNTNTASPSPQFVETNGQCYLRVPSILIEGLHEQHVPVVDSRTNQPFSSAQFFSTMLRIGAAVSFQKPLPGDLEVVKGFYKVTTNCYFDSKRTLSVYAACAQLLAAKLLRGKSQAEIMGLVRRHSVFPTVLFAIPAAAAPAELQSESERPAVAAAPPAAAPEPEPVVLAAPAPASPPAAAPMEPQSEPAVLAAPASPAPAPMEPQPEPTPPAPPGAAPIEPEPEPAAPAPVQQGATCLEAEYLYCVCKELAQAWDLGASRHFQPFSSPCTVMSFVLNDDTGHFTLRVMHNRTRKIPCIGVLRRFSRKCLTPNEFEMKMNSMFGWKCAHQFDELISWTDVMPEEPAGVSPDGINADNMQKAKMNTLSAYLKLLPIGYEETKDAEVKEDSEDDMPVRRRSKFNRLQRARSPSPSPPPKRVKAQTRPTATTLRGAIIEFSVALHTLAQRLNDVAQAMTD